MFDPELAIAENFIIDLVELYNAKHGGHPWHYAERDGKDGIAIHDDEGFCVVLRLDRKVSILNNENQD